MSSNDRMRLVLPISVAGFLGAFLVIGGLYAYLLLNEQQNLEPGALIFFAAFAFPIVCWSAFRFVQILRSIRRYNTRGSVRVT